MQKSVAVFCAMAAVLIAPPSANAQTAALTTVPRLPPGTEVRAISFERLASSLGRGEVVGAIRGGLLCLKDRSITWRGRQNDIRTEDFDEVFAAEVEDAGFKIAGGRSLFDGPENTDFAVGGTLKVLKADICRPLNFDTSFYKGSAEVEVEWQIYSKLERKVVAKVTTDGAVVQKNMTSDGDAMDIVFDAFAESTRKLLVSKEFRDTLIGPSRKPEERMLAKRQDRIAMTVANSAGSVPISDAVGSVVAIFTGDGHGSGFLISSDGYALTNHHVVGDAKYVKVRWSDGFETLGEVLRTDVGRDVALVKTETHGRPALPLSSTSLQPGVNVYAIGAPVDPMLQSTVTKGIVSANRIIGGFSFIQSDVAVSPGNSGGPLLDEKGRVVGITDWKRPDGEALNFFIPIGDAVDFLALTLNTNSPSTSTAAATP